MSDVMPYIATAMKIIDNHCSSAPSVIQFPAAAPLQSLGKTKYHRPLDGDQA